MQDMLTQIIFGNWIFGSFGAFAWANELSSYNYFIPFLDSFDSFTHISQGCTGVMMSICKWDNPEDMGEINNAKTQQSVNHCRDHSRYVLPFPIGWAHTQYDPCIAWFKGTVNMFCSCQPWLSNCKKTLRTLWQRSQISKYGNVFVELSVRELILWLLMPWLLTGGRASAANFFYQHQLYVYRNHSVYGFSQWETLHCNMVSQLSESLDPKRSLVYIWLVVIKSPQYTGGDFMFLYRFECRRRRRRPQILVHAITFEQLFGFLSFLAQLLALTCRLPDYIFVDFRRDLDLDFSRSNMEFAISQPKMVRLPRNEKQTYRLNSEVQMWPAGLTLAMTLTLNFQGQI